MTVALGVAARDGIVLAADRWTSSRGGVPLYRDVEKIQNIGGVWLAHCADRHGLAMSLYEEMTRPVKGESLRERIHAAADAAGPAWSRYFGPARVSPEPVVKFLAAGYEADGTPRFYLLASASRFMPEVQDRGVAVLSPDGFGDGSRVVQDALLYDRRGASIEEARILSLRIVAEAAETYPGIGHEAFVVTLRPDGTSASEVVNT